MGTEIDYWAFIRFGDFAGLINKLDGIRVDIDEAVLDSSYHHGASHGIWFPKGVGLPAQGRPQVQAEAAQVPLCARLRAIAQRHDGEPAEQRLHARGAPAADRPRGCQACRRPLRSRHRAPRPAPRRGGHVETNIPKTPEAAAQLYGILKDVRLPRSNMKVFAPGTWASSAPAFAIRPERVRDPQLGRQDVLSGARSRLTDEARPVVGPRVPSSQGDRVRGPGDLQTGRHVAGRAAQADRGP